MMNPTVFVVYFPIESIDSVTPTIGYSESDILHKNETIKLIDLGGAKNFRDSWRHYYDDAYGFVYVVDSSEGKRIGENRDVLKRLLREEKVKGKPILM
jgi:GTPase SAR1 family protein